MFVELNIRRLCLVLNLGVQIKLHVLAMLQEAYHKLKNNLDVNFVLKGFSKGLD